MYISRKICSLIPKFAEISSKVFPQSLQQQVISVAVNKLLAENIEDGELDFLEGSFLQIKVTDIDISWFFTLVEEKIVVGNRQLASDSCISGTFNSFVLLASQTVDPDALFFKRDLLIEGDVELGLAVKNLLDRVEISQLPDLMIKPLVHYAKNI